MGQELSGKLLGDLPPSAGLEFENEMGLLDPIGLWAPAGFTDMVSRRRRLQHGRVTLRAMTGYLTSTFTGKLSGCLSPSAGLKFEDIPSGLGPIWQEAAAVWSQIVACGAFVSELG